MAEKKTKTRPAQENIQKKPTKEKAPKQKNAKSFLLNKVPFHACYDECGIIESAPGNFSVAYKVYINDKHTGKTVEDMKNGLRKIFSSSDFKDISFQFFIQNSTIEIGDYLDNVHLPENKSAEINKCINAYNQMIDNNAEVGHNNFERSVLVIFNLHAEMVDDAIARFQILDGTITSMFKKTYGYEIKRQTIEERLETIYLLFHPEKTSTYAAKRPDAVSIKAALAPDVYEFKHTGHLKVGKMYAKTLFVNSIPSVVSNTLLNDLMSTASNSVLSILCSPMDTKLGHKVAQKKVDANKEEKRVLIRNTVEDRKNKRSELRVDRKKENEKEYFYEQAANALGEAVENNDVMLMTTFLITLFADTKEDLERNTSLLSLSASKFAVQMRVCEDFQDDAFQSVFPVCSTKVNTARFISSATVATLQPLSAKSAFSNTYSFCGLNSISDNFVLINRDMCRTGVISGTRHCGKSFTVKREGLNKLMNSDDEVIIITRDMKPYQKFTEFLKGETFNSEHVDFYQLSDDERMKRLIFEAFMVNEAGIHIKRMSLAKKKANLENMKKEAEKLCQFNSWNEAVKTMNGDKQGYTSFLSSLRKGHEQKKDYMTGFKKEASFISSKNRLKVIHVENDADLIISMASVLKYIKKVEGTGKKINLFVDYVDGLFFSTVGSDYIVAFMEEIQNGNSAATVVIQDAVRIFTNQDAEIEYKLFLEGVDYYKLLAQGPIERHAYVEKLNIPNSLVPYLTDREPGEGVIITPAENVAFNDRFEKQNDVFYRLFYM